jgi:AcrR family transcriptional regulator
MTGLRDRKKRELRARIIRVAGELFTKNGMDATTMEEIAATADVSVATVYNYFGSKTALLLAGLEDDTGAILAAGAHLLADPGDDPRLATKRLVGAYVEHIAEWDREFLRELMGAAMQRGADDLASEFVHMDQQLIVQITEMLRGFQERGLLAPGVAAEEAAFLVYSVLMTALLIYITVELYPIEGLSDQIGRQIDLVFDGLSPNKGKKEG